MRRLASLGLLLVSSASFAQGARVFEESEPNNTRNTHNFITLRGDTTEPNRIDSVIGVADGSDIDRYYFGCYPTQPSTVSLTTNRAGVQGLYGSSLNANGGFDLASDVLVQPATVSSSGMTNRFVTLGGFQVEAAVSGTGSGQYTTKIEYASGFGGSGGGDLGTFQGSTITITAGSRTIDSDLVLVGRNAGSTLNRVIATNNDAGVDTLGSRIVASNLEPAAGDYVVYLSDLNIATGTVPDANEFARTPGDPRTSLMGFTNLIVPTSPATISIPITISDAYGHSVTAIYDKTGYGMAAFTFRVAPAPVPEPATMAALGLGTLALLRRRRKKA